VETSLHEVDPLGNSWGSYISSPDDWLCLSRSFDFLVLPAVAAFVYDIIHYDWSLPGQPLPPTYTIMPGMHSLSPLLFRWREVEVLEEKGRYDRG
jgi:hypothetical protein